MAFQIAIVCGVVFAVNSQKYLSSSAGRLGICFDFVFFALLSLSLSFPCSLLFLLRSPREQQKKDGSECVMFTYVDRDARVDQ